MRQKNWHPLVVLNVHARAFKPWPYRVILTWRGSKSDHGGVSSRARLFHCTRTGLTPAITANVGNSTVQFLVVGVCVRAHPLLRLKEIILTNHFCLKFDGIWNFVRSCFWQRPTSATTSIPSKWSRSRSFGSFNLWFFAKWSQIKISSV